MSAQWQKKWRRKTEKEKNQIVMVVVIGIVAAYGFGIFQHTYTQNIDTIKMYKRQKNRLEAKKAKSVPKIVNTSGLEKKVKALKAQIVTAKTSREQLQGNFVPLDQPREMQKLRIALSGLAGESGVDILRMVDAGLTRTKDGAAPEAGSLESITNNPYGRPLLQVRAKASYAGLLSFFEELSNLSYKVVVVRYGVFVHEAKGRVSTDKMLLVSTSQKQPLEVSVLLAL